MTMERNNRDDQFGPNDGNIKDCFQEHAERMREFYRSHAKVPMVNGPRCDKAAFLESLQSLQVSRNVMETRGSLLLNGTIDWSTLIRVLKVARYKLSQN